MNFHCSQLGLIIILLGASLFSTCTKDPSSGKVIVDEAFQPYLETYIEEASKRGVEVDFEKTGLSLVFGEVPPNANGVCKGFIEGQTSGHDIVIHRNRWDEANVNWRERLIFHELGHCDLFRAHTADTLVNGEWKSIMRGESPSGFGARSTNFTGTRRSYFIDELFNENVPPPDWANLTADLDAISEDQKTTLVDEENIAEFFRSTDLSGDFEIQMEFVFTNEFQFNFLGFSWGGFSRAEAQEFAISGGNNIFIINRLNGYGIQRIFENYEGFQLDKPNRLTVQKIGDRYYFFYNNSFLYWSDFEPLKSGVVQLTKNEGFDIVINRFTVKQLLN